MISFEDILSKAISHKASIDSAKMDIRDNKVLIQKELEKLQSLTVSNQVTKFSYSYLDALVKEESGKFIKNLTDILNYGVQTIFYDCDYSIDIRVSDTNKATIHLLYEDENGNKLSPDIQNCGGGIRSTIGILLQTYFVFLYKAEPIIFIDEGLSQISSQYVPPVFSLLDELAEKNDLKILLVTHDTRFEDLDTIKHHYEVNNGYIKEITKSKEKEESEDGSNSTQPEE